MAHAGFPNGLGVAEEEGAENIQRKHVEDLHILQAMKDKYVGIYAILEDAFGVTCRESGRVFCLADLRRGNEKDLKQHRRKVMLPAVLLIMGLYQI